MTDVPKGTILSRSVKVDISITEKREGQYDTPIVASHTILVPLPATSASIATATQDAVELLDRTVPKFHGEMVRVIPSKEAAKV